MSAFGGKADIVESHNAPTGRYLSSDVWPSRQARNAAAACSRSSALLNLRRGFFGGWANSGTLPSISSTLCRRIRLRVAIRDQFTRAITHTLSKAAGEKTIKNRRLCRSAPNGPCRWGCRTDNTGAVLPRSNPASIHPRIAAWYKLGKGRCQRVHSKAAGTCRITGGFALAPQTSTWGDVSLGRSNRGIRTNPVQRRKHTPPQSRLGTNWVDSKNFSSNWGGLAIASAHGTGGVIRLSTSARS